MTTDLEADLRREFDAARAPSTLTFSPESIVSQGRRSIRRRRLIACGSAAVAVLLLAVGTTLMTRPHSATPQPATRTATTGTNRAVLNTSQGDFSVEVNRDIRVKPNVKLFVSFKVPGNGSFSMRRQELAEWSINQPGQKPTAIWKSGMVNGHPFTIGLVPGSEPEIRLAKGASYVILSDSVSVLPGYTIFGVEYNNRGGERDPQEPAQPAEITSISWTGRDGVVDGIEGGHRLTGQIFTLSESVSVKVAFRTDDAGRTTVFGSARLLTGSFGSASPLSVATADASGAAVVTGRYPVEHVVTKGGVKGHEIRQDGAPLAAGILPPGASDIGVELASKEAMSGIAKSERLPDGRVIFAIAADFGSTDPNKDVITRVFWTYPGGRQDEVKVVQKKP